jgi:hypothetical protein
MNQYEYEFGYGIDQYGYSYGYEKRKPMPIFNEDAILDTYTNWADEQAKKERTIFGQKEEGLFYNYSDRLLDWDYSKTRRAEEYAELVAHPKTAKYFKAMLSYFHDGAVIDLRHIMAGCNRSNGHPYLVYGYKYEENPDNAAMLAKYDDVRLGRKKAIDDLVVEYAAKFDEAINNILKKPKA